MKVIRLYLSFVLISLMVVVTSVPADELGHKLGIGFNLGGQKLYCDLHDTKFGSAFNILASYTLTPRFSLVFSTGYGLFKESGVSYSKYSAISTRIIPFELRGTYRLLQQGSINPFVSAGLGVFTFKVNQEPFYWDGSIIGGGGIEFMLQEQWGFTIGADYRFTTGDDLDATHTGYSKARDNYLTGTLGLTYYFKKLEEERIREKWEIPTEIIAAGEEKKTLNRLGIGFNLGEQKLYCDLHDTRIGPAFNILVSYAFTPSFSLVFSAGYGQFQENGVSYSKYSKITTRMIPFELKGTYRLLSQGNIAPFISAGLGAFAYKVNQESFHWDGSFLGGGGIEFMVQEQWGLTLAADYRFTTSDNLDATHTSYSKAKDNYLTATLGLTYYFGKPEEIRIKERPVMPPKIIAEREKPLLPPAEPKAKEDILLKLVELKSKIDKLQEQLQQREKQIEKLKVLMAEKEEKIQGLNEQLTKSKEYKRPQPQLRVPLSRAEFKRRYNTGLGKFNARQYRQAIEIFKELLSSNPDHALASNCYYWIGESYNGMGRLSEAIAAFENVRNYRRSFKKDDALMMQGVCYLKLGNRTKAKEFFSRLIAVYPNSEYVVKAKRYLQRLSGTEISMR